MRTLPALFIYNNIFNCVILNGRNLNQLKITSTFPRESVQDFDVQKFGRWRVFSTDPRISANIDFENNLHSRHRGRPAWHYFPDNARNAWYFTYYNYCFRFELACPFRPAAEQRARSISRFPPLNFIAKCQTEFDWASRLRKLKTPAMAALTFSLLGGEEIGGLIFILYFSWYYLSWRKQNFELLVLVWINNRLLRITM